LYLKVWDDSLVVLLNVNAKDSILKRGTIITSINGKTNRELLDKMFDVINSDGYSINFKNQLISNNFPGWYQNVFGLDSTYNIEFINNKGEKQVQKLPIISLLKTLVLLKETFKR
jgi:antibiotic biosynthesis monooxygenase (ABM) superfamily enzyme